MMDSREMKRRLKRAIADYLDNYRASDFASQIRLEVLGRARVSPDHQERYGRVVDELVRELQ